MKAAAIAADAVAISICDLATGRWMGFRPRRYLRAGWALCASRERSAMTEPVGHTHTVSSSSRLSRRRARIACRAAIACAVYNPCRRAFRLPGGAPPPAPCILQTVQPLTAGARHGLPDRFDFARQRGAWFIRDGPWCIGLILGFS